jgi:hypothetical protein
MNIGPRFENCCDKITIGLAFLFRAQLIRFRCVLFSNAFLTPPEIQLKMLPRFVCKADELALDFDLGRGVVLNNFRSQLSTDQM